MQKKWTISEKTDKTKTQDDAWRNRCRNLAVTKISFAAKVNIGNGSTTSSCIASVYIAYTTNTHVRFLKQAYMHI